jgi:hypothetical protein
MERVVGKRSVERKLQAGHYGFRLAVIRRWPLFGGGRSSEVVIRIGITLLAT